MASTPLKEEARQVSKKVLAESRFLRFLDAGYVRSGDDATVRPWQYVERTTTAADSAADAVAIFAVLRSKTKPPELIIVKQYRPPLDKYTIELCAGLIDPGDTPEQSALRELKEETGYTGRVLSVSGKGYVSCGLTNESIITVFVEVDADLPEHQHPPEQSEEDKTMISVQTLQLTGLTEQLNALEAQGYGIWIGLYALAQGMAVKEAMGL